MNESEERAYVLGARRAAMSMLQHCLSDLGEELKPQVVAALQHAEMVSVLRELCAEFGDNDWPDNLHVRDIVEKHLAPHLDELRERAEGGS